MVKGSDFEVRLCMVGMLGSIYLQIDSFVKFVDLFKSIILSTM